MSAKKVGATFLKDLNIVPKIVDSLGTEVPVVLEVGPDGKVLTGFLLQRKELDVHVVEIDREAVAYLQHTPGTERTESYFQDFLKWNAAECPNNSV